MLLSFELLLFGPLRAISIVGPCYGKRQLLHGMDCHGLEKTASHSDTYGIIERKIIENQIDINFLSVGMLLALFGRT